jgi:hypothetical protein
MDKETDRQRRQRIRDRIKTGGSLDDKDWQWFIQRLTEMIRSGNMPDRDELAWLTKNAPEVYANQNLWAEWKSKRS